ncbi:hypothetical protein M2651_12875 [Clostridium sp. SYSU_GA19001]|uniref:alpha-L-rhamnosidase-related protein n=1 Tax=Clostridium caldaquaticum TaxID=2940653 RepID=UPI0020771F88|nr:alpha-L-rhamnosidase C-terminal domain-containing protein [Clostridium caldaquaticum]MCM8711891.1 hypothetical protein [Clostridium caldaquaticum]
MNNNIKATWIWYPGDFEIWQHLKISTRRNERNTIFPVFWKLDTFYPNVVFRKEVFLKKAEIVKIYVDGDFHILIDGIRQRNVDNIITVPEGNHTLSVAVTNQQSVPAIFVEGETIVSDGSWEVTIYDGNWPKAGYWNLYNKEVPPSKFKLPVIEIFPINVEKRSCSYFLDFGKEVYASLKLFKVCGNGKVFIYYGESVEEAMSPEHCVLLDYCEVSANNIEYDFKLRAFRYINIVCEENVEIGKFSAMFEYLPLEYRGVFKCSDERLNEIWEISRYTLHLNTREFFLDGIKRDGWVWSADAYQSFLMNYYCFFNNEVCKRTMIALRGKDPIVSHINTILDYSFFWFLSLYDYYLYTGDFEFLRQNYSKMLTLMIFCLNRTNNSGMVEGLPGDWVFIDWADMDKRGEVSAEQILFCRSLEIMKQISQLLNYNDKADKFASHAKDIRSKILDYYWNEKLGGLVTTRVEEKPSEEITKHANIFALLFHFLNDTQTDSVIKNVILNDSIQKIKTPYFRFYELAALCEAGQHDFVIKEILDYWGGMLDLGATTFWEEYNPNLEGAEHYAMYGEPFDKSLCHAWGASPIYLLGKYYIGVSPLKPGYETYEVKPNLGTLSWIEGSVPTPKGDINVYMDKSLIKVKASSHKGYLRFYSSIPPESNLGEISLIGEKFYELIIDIHNEEYIVKYEPIAQK